MKHFLEELCIAALAWIPTAAGMGARLLLWRPLFKRCGRARFGTGIAMQGCKNMSLADGVRIGRGCQLYAEGGTLDMGEDAALSPGVTVDASGGLIRIGKQVAIGPGTVLRAANHCFDSLEKPIMLQGHLYGEIVIEDDVWIAANCTITPGTRIGHGAVVGAGAVVTRDVEPYAIVGGRSRARHRQPSQGLIAQRRPARRNGVSHPAKRMFRHENRHHHIFFRPIQRRAAEAARTGGRRIRHER